MLTIKEYAKSRGVTSQAVYKRLKVHENVLEGHIKKVNGTRYLDEYAINYLDEQRDNSPSVVVQNGSNERIEELEEENKLLRNQLWELQKKMTDEIIKRDERVAELTDRVLLLSAPKEDEKKKRWWQFGK